MTKETKPLDPFEVYRLPIGLTDGIDIPLPTTDAVFKIRLPSGSNEEFQLALMAAMNVQVERQGAGAVPRINLNPAEFQAQQKKLFFSTCILGATGLPEGMDTAEFLATYPLAARYLFDEALTLAGEADAAVDDAMGKLKPSQSGKGSGEVNSISMN